MRAFLPARADWSAATPRDVVAGITVAVVALPLALGFGVASGLGAAAGLATAIVAGALAAVFGGSSLQVSGPTGAMTVVLVPIVARYGPGGVLTVGLLAGVLLLCLAVAKAGRYMRYVPAPVVEGFTIGIAAVIALQQLPAALGVPNPDGHNVVVNAVRAFGAGPVLPAVALAGGVVVIMLLGAHWKPAVPFSLLAVVVGTLVAEVWALPVDRIGELPALLPAPSLAFLDVGALWSLLPSAVAVAALAALESLLSATVADGMTVNQRHNPDRELFGQGVANVITPMFGGVPATAAIARTAVNVRSGAGSRLAALVHAVTLAVIMLAAAPVVGRIPLAVLAGVLLATAVRMVEVGSVRVLMRANRSDAVVLVLTAVATLAVDLVTAVIVGLVVAGALALRAVARSVRVDEEPLEPGDHTAEEHDLLAEHIVAYRLDGPLFFAAAHRFLLELSEIAEVSVVILRLSHVSTMDGTGAQVLRDAVERLEHRGITVLLSGVREEHRRQLEIHDVRMFASTPEAIEFARNHLRHNGTLP
ncbi:sulfate permease, SulP family [Lentzea fradiae]|uniref:Sulfate permease, SulP family n=1 Tax=Lentzea fradiae TaxID=200378 RepID=A0A1G7KTA7_9PSEU|nr:SulP family inorganic anion transporter [Lentzea fradiae]SDF40463.1 sulfate permease, SulP family [Lentzea fradiae]